MQEAVNLALSYPYLAPLLDGHVFEKHSHQHRDPVIAEFVRSLLDIGIKRIFPDAIAHSLHLAIKYQVNLPQSETELRKIFPIDDCVCYVLLMHYATLRGLSKIRNSILTRANNLKKLDSRDQDTFWLLLYQAWSENDLRGNGQEFLADLKKSNFGFVRFNP